MILYFLLGCFTNRFVRGGDVAKRTEEDLSKWFPEHEKAIKFLISADFLNFLVFIIALGSLDLFPAWQVVVIGGLMWLGAAPTWGQYMGAFIGGEEFGEFTRNKAFDFVPNLLIDYNQQLAGFSGLFLRGLFWGGLLSIGSLSVAPLIVGGFMPATYYLSQKISEKFGYQSGWTIGEFIFGGLLWGSICL